MKSNLKLKVEPSKSDKIIALISWTLLIFLWGLSLWGFTKLPEQIATHYNFEGVADRFSNKLSIYYSPIIATLAIIIATVLSKNPHILRYKVDITMDNAPEEYKAAIKKMHYILLLVIISLVFVLVKTLLTELKIML